MTRQQQIKVITGQLDAEALEGLIKLLSRTVGVKPKRETTLDQETLD